MSLSHEPIVSLARPNFLTGAIIETRFQSFLIGEKLRGRAEDEHLILADLSSAHRPSRAKCQLVQTSYMKRIKFFLFAI